MITLWFEKLFLYTEKNRSGSKNAKVLLQRSMKVGSGCLFLLLVGCSSAGRQPIKYHPIVEDLDFQQSLKNYKITVLAPGSSPSPEKVEALRNLACLPLQFPQALISKEVPFHANGDQKRFELLKQALQDNSSQQIIWAIRGGYGAARLIDKLEKLSQPKTEKWLVGYSDMTALHLFVSQRWQWKTLQGSFLVDFLDPQKDPQNFKKLSDLFSSRISHLELDQLLPLNEAAKRSKRIDGRLTGGNLTLVQNSLGTAWQIQSQGKILFLEDDGEKGYQIDRILYQLKQAGVFKDVKAIVFGEFSGKDEFIDFALQRFALETAIPVFKTDEFGHGVKNYPLLYNAYSTLCPYGGGQFYKLKMRVKN